MFDINSAKIGVIGLGYVGLPLAVLFSKKYDVVGFDINTKRITELKSGKDSTLEVEADALLNAQRLTFTADEEQLKECDIYIVTVPTPIDQSNNPDLTPLIHASKLVGRVISKDNIVIYESTVYPGATEEVCLPVVEEHSRLVYNTDFFAGYSPERINPGDKERPIHKILKVTSGSNPKVANIVDDLYASVLDAGTHLAPNIKTAEASKVIENTQRDVNIALINELSIIFSVLGLDSKEVIDAAATKWNFIKLAPGLVGGHCIGVDPYYLLHKSSTKGYVPDIIRTARHINNGMGRNLINRLVKKMIANDIKIKGASVAIFGFTFKENCPDTRNTRVVDLIDEARTYGMNVKVYDPWISSDQLDSEYDINYVDGVPGATERFDAVILAVAHDEFIKLGSDYFKGLCSENGILFDIKAVFPKGKNHLRP